MAETESTSSSSSETYETRMRDGSTAAVPVSIPKPLGPGVAQAARQGRHRITVGASLRLWSIEGVAEDLGISYDATRKLLDAFSLPILNLPGSDFKYVNLYGLESALFNLTLPDTLIWGADGNKDWALARLHQELAGAMYLGASKEAVRERVKKLAREMKKGLTSDKSEPIIKQPKYREEDYRRV